MYQQQNYYPQRTIPSMSLKGHPVTSIEEAKATAIDFDGSTFYFPDLANNCIYTKQINIDGTVSLKMYGLQELPIAAPIEENNNYITREEFEKCIKALKESLAKSSSDKVSFDF